MQKNRVDEFIKNPKKSLLVLAYPLIIAMTIQVLYNIVDTAFVGRLGAEAIAALTFALPVFFILIAINIGIATGTASRIARMLGAKNKREAENTAMHGLYIAVFLSVIILAVGLLFLRPLFVLLGASNNVLELTVGYMQIVFFGGIFLAITHVLNNIFSGQGNTKTPMMISVTALVINIILDPIFIYVLGYGVKGAAIATIIAFFVGAVMSIILIQKKSYLKIRRNSFKFSWVTLKDILAIGMPQTLLMLLMSVYLVFINRFTMYFGTDYVAAFGMVWRLGTVAILPVVALAIAMMTLVGMFFGAKKYSLMKDIIFYAMRLGIGFTSIIAILLFIFPTWFLRIFSSDPSLLYLSSSYLRIHLFTFPLVVISMLSVRSLQGMGTGLPGFIVNLVRVILVSIPLAYIFIFVLGFGFLSIPVALIIGEFVGMVVAIVWLKFGMKTNPS